MSAATFILFFVDIISVCQNAQIMVHLPVYDSEGSLHMQQNRFQADTQRHNSIFANLYEKFLTPEELINVLFNGSTLYFNEQEILKRVK